MMTQGWLWDSQTLGKKITLMWRWVTPQDFCLAFIDELEKHLFKKLLKWANKKCNLNIYDVILFEKNKHLWSTVPEIECDRMKLVIMGHFWQKSKLKKIEKNCWRCHNFTCVAKITVIRLCFLRYGVWQTIFCHFGPFLQFYPTTDAEK